MFRALLRERLREEPYPLFCFAEGVIPAASIWTGARLWVEAFRNAGFVPGDRILIALPPSPAWLQVFVAAVWEGLTLAFAPESRSGSVIDTQIKAMDARAAVVTVGDRHYFNADWCAGPLSVPDSLRKARHPATRDVLFLLRTSGTESGDGRWIGLSETGVLSVVQSHLPFLGLHEERSRVLSTLPWSHAFGLVIDLLPAVLSGAEIHSDAGGGRDTDSLLDLFADAGITDFCAVPLTVKRLAMTERGGRFLQTLRGGVIGGAPIDEPLSEFLRTTRLRVGYGQTEASPGIALGGPGVFPGSQYLGRALGCETRISDAQTLAFRGANACVGMWSAEYGYNALAPDRWQDTGDLVESTANGDLFFVGRSDAAFKLANGRRIEPESLEHTLRQAFPEVEHLFLYSENGETLTICADVPISRDAAASLLGSPGKLIFQTLVAPSEAFCYTPKGTLRREATRESLRSHMLQFPNANRLL